MRPAATIVSLDDPERVAEWVRQRVPHVPDWGPCAVIGVMRGEELLAGVVYNNYRWPSIEASIASASPEWCSRRNLAAIFAYPFITLKCRRLGAMTEDASLGVIAFLRRLGFREEGVLRDALPSGSARLFGMTPGECRWLPQLRMTENEECQ
ncbi:MAG TPA: GNAT family protein [Stellaceae bacterium]|jgi:RimJ/RimL family protein N-acetyltransferase